MILSFVFVKSRKEKGLHYRSSGASEIYDVKNITIEEIDRMLDGSEFEMYLYQLLLELGYSGVYKTVGSHDYGADLVFSDRSGVRTIIQAKRYSVDYQVGIDAVQEVYTARNFYQAKKAIVITTTKYTDSCETLAGVNGVLLLDRKDLIQILATFKQDDYDRVKDIMEREPRIIYEFWENPERELRKDVKAEQLVLGRR